MAAVSSDRGQWSSRTGFILAAAGSAIGLGNIWRFPYIAGENGGGAFVLLYAIFVFIIGLPYMFGELALGRSVQLNPVGAVAAIDKRWKWVGMLGVLTRGGNTLLLRGDRGLDAGVHLQDGDRECRRIR